MLFPYVSERAKEAGPDSAPMIRCADCRALAPASSMRFREERVKVKRMPFAWPAAYPQLDRRPANADRNNGFAYRVERVPICADCRRRQGSSLLGALAIAGLSVAAAIFVYSHNDLSDSAVGSAVAMLAPATTTAAPSASAGQAPASLGAQRPPATTATPEAGASDRDTPTPPPATATAAAAWPPKAEDAESSSHAAAPAVATGSPIWVPDHKLAREAATGRRRAPPASTAVSLRTSGLSALQSGSYAQAFWQLQQATLMGDAYAPLYLGQMYARGLGVVRDPGSASYWYGIAINRGNAAALVAFRQLQLDPY